MTYISLTSSQRQSCHHETHKTSQSPIGSSLWILFNIGISDVYQNLEVKLNKLCPTPITKNFPTIGNLGFPNVVGSKLLGEEFPAAP